MQCEVDVTRKRLVLSENSDRRRFQIDKAPAHFVLVIGKEQRLCCHFLSAVWSLSSFLNLLSNMLLCICKKVTKPHNLCNIWWHCFLVIMK